MNANSNNVRIGASGYTGTVFVTSNATTSGTVFVEFGKLEVDPFGALSAGAVNIDNSELLFSSTTALTSPLTFTGNNGILSGTGNVQVTSVEATGTGHLISAAIGGSGGLTKTGLGTVTLSGTNTYSGNTSVNAGTLAFDRVAALNSSSGIDIAGGSVLNYTGTSGILSRNVTVTGPANGIGTIRNSGGAPLTLSGTLTKDGKVLQLTGGVFNVTGPIVGSSPNSDLVVTGTSAVTLSASNTYNGPTFVNQASTLIVGATNAIPSNSIVTLGDASSIGTLDLGSFTNAIAQLVFSGSGGTLKMAANQTTGVQLATTGSLTLGSNASLDLTGMLTSASTYRLISYTSYSGSFGSVSGLDPGYTLVYGATELIAKLNQPPANQPTTFTLTPASSRVLVGGSTTLSGLLANTGSAGAAALAWSPSVTGSLTGVTSSSGSSIAAGGTSTITATFLAGGPVGPQNWSIVNTDSNAITTTSTASGSIAVVNDRTFTTPSIAFGRFLNTTNPLSGTSLITSTGSYNVTANSTLGGFTNGTANGLALSLTGGTNAFTGLVTTQTATYTTSGSYSGGLGGFSGSFAATATNEFSGTSAVSVAYTGTTVAQREFTVSNSGTINLGNFLRTGVTGSTTISSSGLYATTASGSLGAFNGTNTNGFSLGTVDSANFDGGSASQQAIYTLSGSAASAGVIGGSFTASVTAELGSISPVSVALVGTAYDPATAILATGGTATGNLWTIDLGQNNQVIGGTSTPWSFSISNLLASGSFTADLVLDSFSTLSNSGAIFMDLTGTSSFPTLVAGGTNPYSAWISLSNTGSFVNTYQLTFKSAKDGQVLGGTQNVTLTVMGVVAVPEPGTLALAGIGIVTVVWAFRRRQSKAIGQPIR